MIRTICDQTVGVFEHIEIASVIDIYLRIKYTEKILIGPELNQFRKVLV